MSNPKTYLRDVVLGLLENALGSAIPVVDEAVKNQPHPYVSISSMSSANMDDSCTRRWEIELTILAVSQYKGFKELDEIQNTVDTALAYHTDAGSEYYIIGIIPISDANERDDLKRIGTQTFNCIIGQR